MKPDTMRRCRSLVVLFFLVAPFARGEASRDAVDELVGTWRGSSVCVDLQAAPACNDEQVIYETGASPGKPNAVTVRADKIVDGKRVPMGDLDFTYDVTSRSWTTDVETPRIHFVWRLAVGGTTLTGSMTLLPSKAVVRRVDLRKDK